MRKKLIITNIILILMLAFTNNFYCNTSIVEKKFFSNPDCINQVEAQEKLQNDLLLRVFSPYIAKAIENYYGEPRQFDLWNAKISNIKRLHKGSFNFKIMISVTTFKGAHNSPYGLETITLKIDDLGIHVIDFQHQKLTFIDTFQLSLSYFSFPLELK